MRKIKARAKYPTVMERIKPFMQIVDSFHETDEEFEDIATGSVELVCGHGRHRAKTYVCPETWDYIEQFVRLIVCHEIEVEDKQNTEVYGPIYEQYKRKLQENPIDTESFVY